MIDKILIKSFRLFEDLELGNLPHVNLIAGANNTGKTALLEAILLTLTDMDRLIALPGFFRGATGNPTDDFLNFWDWMPRRGFGGERSLGVEISTDDGFYEARLGEQKGNYLPIELLKDGSLRLQYNVPGSSRG
ncbi:MAG: AAA family ATPase, partial [Blastocatellia bacterium]